MLTELFLQPQRTSFEMLNLKSDFRGSGIVSAWGVDTWLALPVPQDEEVSQFSTMVGL